MRPTDAKIQTFDQRIYHAGIKIFDVHLTKIRRSVFEGRNRTVYLVPVGQYALKNANRLRID